MALITCPDCKTEISDAAAACIKCGRPMTDVIGRERAIRVKPQTSCVTMGCAVIFAVVVLLVIFQAAFGHH